MRGKRLVGVLVGGNTLSKDAMIVKVGEWQSKGFLVSLRGGDGALHLVPPPPAREQLRVGT